MFRSRKEGAHRRPDAPTPHTARASKQHDCGHAKSAVGGVQYEYVRSVLSRPVIDVLTAVFLVAATSVAVAAAAPPPLALQPAALEPGARAAHHAAPASATAPSASVRIDGARRRPRDASRRRPASAARPNSVR